MANDRTQTRRPLRSRFQDDEKDRLPANVRRSAPALCSWSPVMLAMIDGRGVITDANLSLKTFFQGTDPVGRLLPELVDPTQREVFAQRIGAWFDGQVAEPFETRLVSDSGTVLAVDCMANVLTPKSCMVTLVDASYHRDRERELTRRESVFRSMFERNHLAMMLVKAQSGEILEVNDAAAEFWGFTREEFAAMKVFDVLPFDAGQVRDLLCNAVMNQEHRLVLKTRLKHGALRSIEMHVSPVQVGEILLLSGILHDITGRKEVEAETLKHQRLESIGSLAGGIAHDFNNLLQIITGNLSLLELIDASEDTGKIQRREHLDRIEAAIERAKWITRQLLTFSEGGAPTRQPGQLGELVREVTDFTLGGSNLLCEYDIHDQLPDVAIDESQIRQAVQNIVLNARQAMTESGLLTVTLSCYTPGDAHCFPYLDDIGPTRKHPRFLRLTVSDNGSGISDENLPRVFDPYFTTKDMARGLGLSIVYSIIRKHDGYIRLQSEPGRGTTVTVLLPALPRPHEAVGETIPVKGPVFGSGRVLYMDDDPMLVDVTSQMLSFLGYEAITANRGEEVLDLYKRHMDEGTPIDLMILDLTIPGGMGGLETLRRVRELDPGAMAILASGYTTSPELLDPQKAGFVGALTKPFYINEVSQLLHRLMKPRGV